MEPSLPWLSFSLPNPPPNLFLTYHGDDGGSAMHVCPESAVQLYDSELKNPAGGILTVDCSKAARSSNEAKRAVDSFGQRTSVYRGVTRHRWTGRYEAHLWDNSCRREGQIRKGRQVYLGGYDKEEKAARAYDLAALKYWGSTTTTNFLVSNYEKELEEMQNMTRQEFIASIRRKSSGFSRGASMYRGVTRHHQHGRWQARIGRVAGNKDLYLGTFSTQEEAAEAYDIAAIKFRGLNAVTNFDMSRYDVKSIAHSNLPVGGVTGKTPASESPSPSSSSVNKAKEPNHMEGSIKQDDKNYWSLLELQNSSQNEKSSANPSASAFHSSTLPKYTSGFSTASSQGNDSFFDDGRIIRRQSQSVIRFGTPIAIPGKFGNPGFGIWVPPPCVQGCQGSKSNLFHTAIFGRE